MIGYQKDFKIFDIVNNKRVVLIGPSPHLVDKECGSLFNQYDVVCRMNDIMPYNFESDYGSRTDLLFETFDYRFMDNIKTKWALNKKKTKEVKLIVVSCLKADHTGKANIFDHLNEINKEYNLPYTFIGVENYNRISHEIGTEPNTGLVSMLMLLEHDIKELFITGFTFFQDNRGEQSINYHYGDYYLENKESAIQANPTTGHSQPQQIKYFKEKILPRKEVYIDSYLNKLLNLNHERIIGL